MSNKSEENVSENSRTSSTHISSSMQSEQKNQNEHSDRSGQASGKSRQSSRSSTQSTRNTKRYSSLASRALTRQIQRARASYHRSVLVRQAFFCAFILGIIVIAIFRIFFKFTWWWEILPCLGIVLVLLDGAYASKQWKKRKLTFQKNIYREQLSKDRSSAISSKARTHTKSAMRKDIQNSEINGDGSGSDLETMPTFAIPIAEARLFAKRQLEKTHHEHPNITSKSTSKDGIGNKENDRKHEPDELEKDIDSSVGPSSAAAIVVWSTVRKYNDDFADRLDVDVHRLDEASKRYSQKLLNATDATNKSIEDADPEFIDPEDIDPKEHGSQGDVAPKNGVIKDDVNKAMANKAIRNKSANGIIVEGSNKEIKDLEKIAMQEISAQGIQNTKDLLWDNESFEDVKTKHADDDRLIFFSFGNEFMSSQSTGKDPMIDRKQQGILTPPAPPLASDVSINDVSDQKKMVNEDQPHSRTLTHSLSAKGRIRHRNGTKHEDIYSRAIKSVRRVAKAIPLSTSKQETIKRSATPSIVDIPAVSKTRKVHRSRH